MCINSLEFRFSSLCGVLPTDEANEVMDAGVGNGHHHHWMDFILSNLHWEVDVDLFGSGRAYVALWGEGSDAGDIKVHLHHAYQSPDYSKQGAKHWCNTGSIMTEYKPQTFSFTHTDG